MIKLGVLTMQKENEGLEILQGCLLEDKMRERNRNYNIEIGQITFVPQFEMIFLK